MTSALQAQAPVQYLLVVAGEPSLLSRFVESVAKPGSPDKLFQPSLALPAPADLADVDPFAIPYYFLIENKYFQAAAAFEEFDLEPELAKLLREPGSRYKAQELLRERLDVRAMQGVPAIRDNVRRYNVLSKTDWAKRKWSGLDDRLVCSERRQVSDTRVEYEFGWHLLDTEFLENLAPLHPQLTFGLVGVDSVNAKQAFAWLCDGSNLFAFGNELLHAVDYNWLEEHPEQFRT